MGLGRSEGAEGGGPVSGLRLSGLRPALAPASEHYLAARSGCSAIEASKIAGPGSVNMTNDYAHVQLTRQDELTRAIQDRVARAREKQQAKEAEEQSGKAAEEDAA